MTGMGKISASLLALSLLLVAGGKNTQSSKETAVISIPAPHCKCKPKKVYRQPGTCLMWQDAPYTDAEEGAYRRNYSVGKAGNWMYAVNYCRALHYMGYSDWRLPTADELMAVHEMLGNAFSYSRDGDFWTSTPADGKRYYVVYPADAYRYKRNKNESNFIRCVRCVKEKKDASMQTRMKPSRSEPLFKSR